MSKQKVSFWHKVVEEIEKIALVSLYFFTWLAILMFVKRLMLADYDIKFSGIGIALISSLIMAKVVLLMDLIKLGRWVEKQPAIVDVVIRTLMYTAGVLFVQLLEKSFESRHEEGGFGKAFAHVFHHRDIYKVWVGTLIVGISLFFFNVFDILNQYFEGRQFYNIFFKTPLEEINERHKQHKHHAELEKENKLTSRA